MIWNISDGWVRGQIVAQRCCFHLWKVVVLWVLSRLRFLFMSLGILGIVRCNAAVCCLLLNTFPAFSFFFSFSNVILFVNLKMVYIHLLAQDLVLHSFILKEKPKQTILCHCSSESESVLFACCTNSNIKEVSLLIYHIKTTDVDQSVE